MAGNFNNDYDPSKVTAEVQAMDFESHESVLPQTKIYHGMDIAVTLGKKAYRVGRIQSWAPQSRTRQAVHKYELSSSRWGRPVDIIPGRAEGYTVSLSRAEVWSNEVERVFGLVATGNLFIDLMDMRWPITLVEYLYRGTQLYSEWTYPNCWITSYGESEYSAEGDGVITTSLEVMHLPRILTAYHPTIVSTDSGIVVDPPTV